MAAFSWEGGGVLPQNSYKPTKDQGDAIMHRRTISVEQLSRYFSTHTHIDPVTLNISVIYFYI